MNFQAIQHHTVMIKIIKNSNLKNNQRLKLNIKYYG